MVDSRFDDLNDEAKRLAEDLVRRSRYDELDEESKELIEEGSILAPTICPYDDDFCWYGQDCFYYKGSVCSRYKGE